MAFKTQFCALESKRGGCVSRTVRRWSTILQQKSQNRSIQLLRWCLKNSWIANATVVQSSRRRRRLIGRRSRVRCATARSLAQVGCCFRAVDVIGLSWLLCRRFWCFFDRREMRWWIVDRIFRHEKLELRVRVTRCHESSGIVYGRSKIRDICAEQLVSEKRYSSVPKYSYCSR